MNQRQRAFCEGYLKCGNAAEAARKAGYSARTARSLGQRLLTNADISKYIQRRREEISAEQTAQVDEVRRFWSAVMRDDSAKPKDRLRASELLGKSYGAFIEQFIIQERARSAENGSREETAIHLEMLREYLSGLSADELRALAAAYKSGAFDRDEPIIYIPDNGREK